MSDDFQHKHVAQVAFGIAAIILLLGLVGIWVNLG